MKSAIDKPDPEGWVSEDYFDLDGHKKKHWYTAAAYAKRQARLLMRKKTAKEVRPYKWMLGYNHCIGQYAPNDEYPTLSGSSLNRSLKQKKDDNLAKLYLEEPEPVPDQVPRCFSKRSRAKVKDKATAFWRALESKKLYDSKTKKPAVQRTFATLTFVELIPDQLGVKILNKFLTVLRKEHPTMQYLWVAEPQEENNNNIHFHMLLDRRLDIKRYNALWVLQQYNAGLIGHRADGSEISKQQIQQRYDYDMNSTFTRKDPDSVAAVLNPFSIEKASSITGLSFYLTQYITKQAKNHTFSCQTWHCSRRVSRLFTKEIVSPSTFRYMCSFTNAKVDRETGEVLEEAKPIYKQWFTMVFVNNKASPLARLRQMEQVNKWIIQDFEPDKLPVLSDWLYRKILINEKEPAGKATKHPKQRLPELFD